jgi:hypothetical protein
MENQSEAKMEMRERQRPKGHKPECLCWYCSRPPVPKEEFMPGPGGTGAPVDDCKSWEQ